MSYNSFIYDESVYCEMQQELKIALAIVAMAAVAGVAVAAIPLQQTAEARIVCKNPGGQEPQGNCQGANERQNPAGHAPPGQN
jgi:hypothetical protein